MLGHQPARLVDVLVGPYRYQVFRCDLLDPHRLGSRPATTTRATMSRSVTIPTVLPPSTTGGGPFSCWIVR